MILLSGAAGYIGSHTCIALLEAGYEVVGFDNFANSSPVAIDRIEQICGKRPLFYECDMLDEDGLEAIFQKHKIEALVHFAGLKAVGESTREPLKYYHTNIVGTLNLLEAMRKHGANKFLFSSSATVYGADNPVPYLETMKIGRSSNPYGQTKIMIEQILEDIYKANPDWGVSLLRYFNPIGAHESGLIGEDPAGEPQNLSPYITQVAVGRREKVTIFGDDYDTPDGTGLRDYIHVVDLAKGHVSALERLLKQPGLDIYNLGTGKGTSVLEMVKGFEEVSGKKIPYEIGPRRAGDLAAVYADVSKAKRELGWQAEYDVMRMCQDSWRWQQQNPFGYSKK